MPHTRTETLNYKNITVADLAFPRRSGGYTKGKKTREHILHAALVILVSEGNSAMTMRRIAAACDMKLGNLTYHYPSREDLIKELLDAVITAYEIEFDKLLDLPDHSADERLAEICGVILEDIRTEKTTKVFPELWSLSNQDPFIEDRVQDLYARARAPLEKVITDIRPDLCAEDVADLALFISASMEGLTVFAGYEKPFEARMANYEIIAIQSFIEIVRTYKLPSGASDEQ